MAPLRERIGRVWDRRADIRLPRILFGAEDPARREPSPVTTYYLIVIPAMILIFFGLVMGFSAQAVTNIAAGENPYIAYLRPLGIILLAVVVAAFVQMIPPNVFRGLARILFAFSIVFQSLVRTSLGVSEGGNSNWVKIPGLPMMQPSEFLKLALVLVIAAELTRPGQDVTDLKKMLKHAGIPIVLGVGAVLLGHDMGTAMVVAIAAFGALWVARLPAKWFVVMGLIVIPGLAFLVFSNATRLRRIMAILPWNAAERNLSAPEQIDHSLWALGSGGLTGLGPGASREKWNYLQAAHTDFIFAIIGEEFGLLGTLAVLTSIGLLIWGMIRVIQETDNRFSAIAAAGVASWIGIQAIINVMSVTGIGPVVGVPLPLVSYGGSSFLFTAIAVGVVASFARDRAGMRMIGRPDESSAGRDPRIAPKRRRAR